MTVLTIDLGTSATKAALWGNNGLLVITRADLTTSYPRPGWVEQDPADWWSSAVEACAALRAAAPDAYGAITAVGFAAARETFALFDADLEPLGPGVLWSDQRGTGGVLHFGDPDEFRFRTGVVLNGACCAAKIGWVSDHEPERFAAARWILAPRDYVAARLTGDALTDETLASRTGLYSLDGTLTVGEELASRLPPVLPAAHVVGPARGLDLPPDAVLVLGAGDRACEVLGTGASTATAMVSWGTTTNVSVPHPGPVAALPQIATISRGALGGFVVEAGLSASGAALDWLARLTGRPVEVLVTEAAGSPPGADGVVALPWLHGARAPWWRADANAAFTGLSAAHGPGDLARAIVESVALDVARCLELIAPDAIELVLAGGGAGSALWREVLTGATGHPLLRRAVDDAASVGARLVTAVARGEDLVLDALNPPVGFDLPDPELVERYGEVRAASDAAAQAVLGVTTP